MSKRNRILPLFLIVLLSVLFLVVKTNPIIAQSNKTTITKDGNKWRINGQLTYPNQPAQGLLMNVRMVNTVFEDSRDKSQWPSGLPQSFTPDANTTTFLNKLPQYIDSGMLGYTISLQGGFPGYEGAHNSAFNSNGSLRTNYMNRVKSVIDAADSQGAVIILSLFYQRQHNQSPTYNPRALSGNESIKAAVVNTVNWIKTQGYTNVLLEISNEYAHRGYEKWQDGNWLSSPSGQVELIQLAKSTLPGLQVSTSGMGNGRVNQSIVQAADFVIIHFNNTALGDYQSRITTAKSYGKPVVVNEDDKLGASGADAAARSVQYGASWGFMHNAKNQYVPFEYNGTSDDQIIYSKVRQLTKGSRAGDANGDGSVNGIDYIIWLSNYGTSTGLGSSKGDFNNDGAINGLDYIIWLNNYGN